MPRKLVNIGENPQLPTIQEFFTAMADRQHEEIRRLKEEVGAVSSSGEASRQPRDPRKPVPDPWLLHPVRIKRGSSKKRTAAKKKRAVSRKRSAGKRNAAQSRQKP